MAKLRNRGEFELLTGQRAGGGRVSDTLLVYTVAWGHPGGALIGNQTCSSLTQRGAKVEGSDFRVTWVFAAVRNTRREENTQS